MKPLAFLAAALLLAAPAYAIPLTVDIVGPDDKPLPGAQLSVLEGTYRGSELPEPRDISGQNGHFAWEWDGAFPAKDAPFDVNRKFVVARIAAPGMATQTRFINKAETTIHLGAGRVWGGQILDADEKPVAGVTVRLSRWEAVKDGDAPAADPDDPREIASYSEWGKKGNRSAISDANGRWQLDAMPAEAQASVALSDPRFVSKTYALTIGAGDAPPLFVRAGATISGQIVTPDGQPIADAPVTSGWNGGEPIRTDAQGRFTLTGVEPGDVTLRAVDYSRWDAKPKADPGYAISAFDKVRVEAGQTLDIGQWKAQKGLLVRATLVEADTKKPLEGAQLNFYGNGMPNKSDAAGRIEMRVTPEDLRNGGPTIGQASADDHVGAQVMRPATLEGEVLDLGTIELARGVALSGSARVEGEDPKTATALPNLMLSDAGNQAAYIQFWRSSKFTTQALKPGTYKLTMGYDMQGQNKDWQIVSPQNVTVPAVGADKPAPLEIVLKRLTPAPTPLGKMMGRVVDTAGQGVGGAQITAQLRASNSSSQATAISAQDGSFTLNSGFPATEVEITGVERPGYLLAGTPKTETKDGATVFSDLILKRRGGALKGRVVDADGQGAAGAWVAALEAKDYPPVQTGADGHFKMIDLPLENFTLIGAHGLEFGKMESSASATNVELKLQTPPAPDRKALAEQALQGQLQWWNIEGYWDALGSARMMQLALRDGDADRARETARQLARRDPAEFARRAPALIEKLDGEARDDVQAQWMLIRAGSDEADDRIAANDWLDTQKMVKRQINAASVTQLLQMAAVATKLKRDDAGDWLDYAAAINAQLGGGAGESQQWGALLGGLGYDGVTHFVEGAKPATEFGVWAAAATGLAQNGDAAGARRALARLDELAKTPELVEAGKKEQWNNPANQIAGAKSGVASELAASDPASALEMVSALNDEWQKLGVLLKIADGATTLGQKEVAERALRAAFKAQSGNVEKFALAASLAQRLDPKLGAEMWEDAYNRAVPTNKSEIGNYRPSVGAWAMYHARLDPARSRVLIEREWNWRLPSAIKNKDAEYSNDGSQLSQLIMGMAAVDPARALEMREAAREAAKKDAATNTEVGLAAVILAGDEQRARLGVDARY